jgi:hypothetical protein
MRCAFVMSVTTCNDLYSKSRPSSGLNNWLRLKEERENGSHKKEVESVSFFNDKADLGSIARTSLKIS